ncbi:MAG: MotA/TolQ/ExbB proton channel family protein [Halobacteria archaeon]
MDISSAITTALYMVSTSLLYPVVIALLVLAAYSFILLGAFLSEYASRNRNIAKLREGCEEAKKFLIEKEYARAAIVLKGCGSNDLLKEFMLDLSKLLGNSKFALEGEMLLQDYEIRIVAALEKPKLLIRIGPMLGLMGTLIPMGPALIGLSTGNIQQLASNLVIAFTTTVVGLLIGGIGFIIFTIKRRWYAQDLSDMEYAVKILGG